MSRPDGGDQPGTRAQGPLPPAEARCKARITLNLITRGL